MNTKVGRPPNRFRLAIHAPINFQGEATSHCMVIVTTLLLLHSYSQSALDGATTWCISHRGQVTVTRAVNIAGRCLSDSAMGDVDVQPVSDEEASLQLARMLQGTPACKRVTRAMARTPALALPPHSRSHQACPTHRPHGSHR